MAASVVRQHEQGAVRCRANWWPLRLLTTLSEPSVSWLRRWRGPESRPHRYLQTNVADRCRILARAIVILRVGT